MNNNDYIVFNGVVTSIRDNYDDEFVYFDIGKYETYVDKDGKMKTNPSFFSARMYKFYMKKIGLSINMQVCVKGIPKGYIDKKGYRQNYIQVTEINDVHINKDVAIKYGYDEDGVEIYNGKRCEINLASPEEQAEMQRMIDEITGDIHE